MIEWITLLGENYNVFALLGNHTFCINSRWNGNSGFDLRKFLYHRTHDGQFRMGSKHSQFFLTPFRSRNIITIHPGDKVVLTRLNTNLQSMSKATVLLETDDM